MAGVTNVSVVAQGADGRQYVVRGRLRGRVRFKGGEKIWIESMAFDHLLDPEDLVEVIKLPTSISG
jgi:hypothetical protein